MDKIEMDKIEAGQGERVLRNDELDTVSGGVMPDLKGLTDQLNLAAAVTQPTSRTSSLRFGTKAQQATLL
jgi:hypothetical protein